MVLRLDESPLPNIAWIRHAGLLRAPARGSSCRSAEEGRRVGMPRLIQFMHPGGQPQIRAPGRKEWNTRSHCRSFLAVDGTSTRDVAGAGGISRRLGVWAEWEASARAVPTGSPIAPYAFEPVRPVFPSEPRLQNTDPYIFDGPFIYSNCRQVRKNGRPTQLRELARGDVILFGSHLDRQFVLDTVFVVADSVLFRPSTGAQDLSSLVPSSFVEATLRPLAGIRRPLESIPQSAALCGPEECDDDDDSDACGAPCSESSAISYRLYRGATPETPIDGMFSFAPARPIFDQVLPFPRPSIGLSFISEALRQNWRSCAVPDIPEAWRSVAHLVLESGLELGTYFEFRGRE